MSKSAKFFIFLLVIFNLTGISFAQPPEEIDKKDRKKPDNKVRTVTIPISIFSKQELHENQTEEYIEAGSIIVKEDNDEQVVLSIRSVSNTPMALAILIQENLSASFNLELQRLSRFISRLPKGSRVMVAYLRGGSIQVRQKFTEDLEKAAGSLRIVNGSSFSGPSNPYEGVREALNRFDSIPGGRRAILLVSDGLDASAGGNFSSPTQSIELDRAILMAQRKSVAVYAFYSTTGLTENGRSIASLNGQSSLNRLAEETGGRAFFQGTFSPVNMEPFFVDLDRALTRQFALTYLSTHPKKGYHKVQVYSTNSDVKIEHPKSYYYR
jgi:VWFA-related protein